MQAPTDHLKPFLLDVTADTCMVSGTLLRLPHTNAGATLNAVLVLVTDYLSPLVTNSSYMCLPRTGPFGYSVVDLLANTSKSAQNGQNTTHASVLRPLNLLVLGFIANW